MLLQCSQPNSNIAACPDCLRLAQIWQSVRGQSQSICCPVPNSPAREETVFKKTLQSGSDDGHTSQATLHRWLLLRAVSSCGI